MENIRRVLSRRPAFPLFTDGGSFVREIDTVRELTHVVDVEHHKSVAFLHHDVFSDFPSHTRNFATIHGASRSESHAANIVRVRRCAPVHNGNLASALKFDAAVVDSHRLERAQQVFSPTDYEITI